MSASQPIGSPVPRHISVLAGKAMAKISAQVGRKKRDSTAALPIATPDSTNTVAIPASGNLNHAPSTTRHDPPDSGDAWTDDDSEDDPATSNHWDDIDNDSLEEVGSMAGAEPFRLRRHNQKRKARRNKERPMSKELRERYREKMLLEKHGHLQLDLRAIQELQICKLRSKLIRQALHYRYSAKDDGPAWLQQSYWKSTIREYKTAIQDLEFMDQDSQLVTNPFTIPIICHDDFRSVEGHLKSLERKAKRRATTAITSGGCSSLHQSPPQIRSIQPPPLKQFSASQDLLHLRDTIELRRPKTQDIMLTVKESKNFRSKLRGVFSSPAPDLVLVSLLTFFSIFGPMLAIMHPWDCPPVLVALVSIGLAAAFLPCIMKEKVQVITALAAYAAVLVVFIGENGLKHA